MKKKKITIIKMKTRYLALMFLVLISCQSQQKEADQNEVLVSILRDSLNIVNYKDYNYIYLLTEKGCINCNKSYARLIEDNMNENSLYIINAVGRMVDISHFKETKRPNVVFDYENYFLNNSISSSSSFIDFTNQKIDTIIQIDAKELLNQFEIIKNYEN